MSTAKKQQFQTSIKLTPEEREAMDYIREQKPEFETDAAARRASIFELARSLG